MRQNRLRLQCGNFRRTSSSNCPDRRGPCFAHSWFLKQHGLPSFPVWWRSPDNPATGDIRFGMPPKSSTSSPQNAPRCVCGLFRTFALALAEDSRRFFKIPTVPSSSAFFLRSCRTSSSNCRSRTFSTSWLSASTASQRSIVPLDTLRFRHTSAVLCLFSNTSLIAPAVPVPVAFSHIGHPFVVLSFYTTPGSPSNNER